MHNRGIDWIKENLYSFSSPQRIYMVRAKYWYSILKRTKIVDAHLWVSMQSAKVCNGSSKADGAIDCSFDLLRLQAGPPVVIKTSSERSQMYEVVGLHLQVTDTIWINSQMQTWQRLSNELECSMFAPASSKNLLTTSAACSTGRSIQWRTMSPRSCRDNELLMTPRTKIAFHAHKCLRFLLSCTRARILLKHVCIMYYVTWAVVFISIPVTLYLFLQATTRRVHFDLNSFEILKITGELAQSFLM